jgi:malate dehydrogenase (oxaloacetate-decarboxylating)(NADP+)
MDGEDPKEVMRREALAYHEEISRGKYEVVPTKKMEDINDLSLAYSPGVAFPCLEIAENPQTSFILTNRANSVGIFTNGTACMSLGDIGVHAAKPAMEGVVVLMKQLGDVDALDVGVDTKDPEEFVN